MKKDVFCILLLLLLSLVNMNAQTTIGKLADPHSGALLELVSNNSKGLLLPCVSLTANPSEFVLNVTAGYEDVDKTKAVGMIVYNTNAYVLSGKGVYLWDGRKWTRACGADHNMSTYTVSVDIEDLNGLSGGYGTVSGDGLYAKGAPVTLTVTSKAPNYLFKKWVIDDIVVSTNETYSFTMPENAVSVKAVFATEYTFIYDWADLAAIAHDLNGKYKLANSLDKHSGFYETMSGGWDMSSGTPEGWIPLGNETMPFTGIFDGNGFEILDLWINRTSSDYQALFGVNAGIIQNLGLGTTGEGIKGGYYVGGIAGSSSGTISRCYNTGYIAGIGNETGGIAGRNSGNISECYNEGEITGADKSGGIAGNSSGRIENCYNIAPVGGNEKVGGIAGETGNIIKNSAHKNIFILIAIKHSGLMRLHFWKRNIDNKSCLSC